MSGDLRDLIAATPWLDTHEHLPEEALRLEAPVAGSRLHPCDDWAYLLWHYALDDLVSAGLTPAQRQVFESPDAGPTEKWDAVAEAYGRTRHSAYLRAARDSIRTLFGLELGRDTVAEIDRRMAELRRPGFYRRVLDIAGVSACQVNSLEATFRQTADPERLQQDIGLTDFVLPSEASVAEWEAVTGHEVAGLPDLLAVMGTYFERFSALRRQRSSWPSRTRVRSGRGPPARPTVRTPSGPGCGGSPWPPTSPGRSRTRSWRRGWGWRPTRAWR